MELLTTTQRNFKTFAGFLGIIQSLTWIVLSIIYLVIHDQERRKSVLDYDSYMGEVQYFLYAIYVNDEYKLRVRGQVLTSYSFIVVAIIYLILNLAWTVTSLNIIFRQNNKVSVSLKLWSLVTWCICLCDFIVVIILGTDYQKCLDEASGLETEFKITLETICANGILPVLMIAAKGFVLWLVNLGLLIVLLKISKNIKLQELASFHVSPTLYYPQTSDPQRPFSQINSPQPHRHSLPINPYYRQSPQPALSPTYQVPYQPNSYSPTPKTSAAPTRKWRIHSGSPQSSPTSSRGTNWNGNRPTTPTVKPTVQRVPSRQVLSNQTQRPFVLHTPPRRH